MESEFMSLLMRTLEKASISPQPEVIGPGCSLCSSLRPREFWSVWNGTNAITANNVDKCVPDWSLPSDWQRKHVEGLPRLLAESAAVLWLQFPLNNKIKRKKYEARSEDAAWDSDAPGENSGPERFVQVGLEGCEWTRGEPEVSGTKGEMNYCSRSATACIRQLCVIKNICCWGVGGGGIWGQGKLS